MEFTFDADLWRWESRRAFYTFVSLPPDVEDQVLMVAGDLLRGWGSVRVEARVGSSTFATSVFPLGDENAYALPVKRAVRDAEGVGVGDTVAVRLRLLDF
ncbi:DUF1905 domain-containing protein [Frigoribacterium sp. MCBA15_019]|uniref:DUF1905 domain-containing protein n=1 Tax=Frigoribacterium sp. MCBA15_019 TaxID=1898745 RepID=UPI0008DCF7FC|nr:DUF1905 domain-containing protein [Frigoribacterium sp. MCBA15_019]OII26229.1 hypothetical protein BIV04_11965 [Frigoribacterium sp. MCBA15_019]